MKKPKIYVGGQAVIEGVMMRSPKTIATAVRTPSGEITVKKDAIQSIAERYPILKKPFLRGTVALVESLIYGMKSLSYSAQAAGEEEEQLSSWQMALTMGISVLLAIVFFLVIPTYAAKFIPGVSDSAFRPSFIERIISRIVLMPVVAGISYEMIRLAGRTTSPVIQTIFRPGLWLQYLTTREPHADQIEVAIEAMKAAKPADEGDVTEIK